MLMLCFCMSITDTHTAYLKNLDKYYSLMKQLTDFFRARQFKIKYTQSLKTAHAIRPQFTFETNQHQQYLQVLQHQQTH